MAFLVLYSGVAVYLLLKSNPYLYAQDTLNSQYKKQEKAAITPWPPVDSHLDLGQAPMGESAPWPYLTKEHLNITSPENTRNKSYTEYKAYDLNKDFEGKAEAFLQTKDFVYLRDESGQIFRFDMMGNLKWSYLPSGEPFIQALIDQNLLYLIAENGKVTALQVASGQPQWTLNSRSQLFGEAWIQDKNLILPVEELDTEVGSKKANQKSSSLLKIVRKTGQLEEKIVGFDFKGPFGQVPAGDLRLIHHGTQLIAISKNLDKGVKVEWTTNLPAKIQGDLSVYDGSIFALTEGNRLYGMNLKKKGEMIFDIDLDVKPAGGLSYLPEMERIAYLSSDSILRVIDLKAKNKAWRFDLGVGGPMRDLWSARLKGSYIQEFGMKWVHKGWTIWSPCRKQHFCIYNPEKGQLIQRIELSGEPLELPIISDDKMIVLVKKPSGKIALSHLLEPIEYKNAVAKDEAAQVKKDED